MKYYFPSAPCKRGHIDKYFVSNGHCVSCAREDSATERVRIYHKEYYANNKAKFNLNKAKLKKSNPSHYRNYASTYVKTRCKSDPVYAIKCRLRRRLCKALKACGAQRSAHTFDLVGCTPQELQQHLESKFYPHPFTGETMTWENRDKWHLDHIKPCISFDLADPEQQRKCFHYSNLQPLWAKDNLEKRAKF